jgi:site-specific recombinase XerD
MAIQRKSATADERYVNRRGTSSRDAVLQSWEEMIAEFVKAKRLKNENTGRFYRLQLLRYQAWLKALDAPPSLKAFRATDANTYLMFRKETPSERTGQALSARTLRADALVLKELSHWGRQNRFLDVDVLREYEVPHKEEVVIQMPSTEEVSRILQAITDRWDPAVNPDIRYVGSSERRFHRRRDMAILTGLIETAMRPGEMCNLTMSDFDPEKKQVLIRTSKTHTHRYIPVTGVWIEVVNDWLKIRPNLASAAKVPPEQDWLFMSTYGDKLHSNGLGRQFRDYRDFAKLEGFTLYGFRHYTITKLVETGDIAGVATLAGHSDWRTTKGYNHTNADHVRGVHTQVSPLASVMRHKRGKEAIEAKAATKEKRQKLC